MSLNTGKFWSLEKPYYSESQNVGVNKYNTYEHFVSGIRSDSILSGFAFNNPFNFTPSYGTSVDFRFSQNLIEYGDGYSASQASSMNNTQISFSLSFSAKTDRESTEIIEYIKGTGSHGYFPFQANERSSFPDSDAYKSLYSIPPYFVQEFRCEGISSNKKYINNNDLSLTFVNQNTSDFTSHNILDIPSMPQATRDILSGAREKTEFDIKPSYITSADNRMRSLRLGSKKSRPWVGEDGINRDMTAVDLSFDNINDEKLLRILGFLIEKGGNTPFMYELSPPYSGRHEFLCTRISHSYVFKGSHRVRCRFIEVY